MPSPVSPQINARVQLTVTDSWHGVPPAPDGDVRVTLRVGDTSFVARFSTPNGHDFTSANPVVVPVEFMAPDLASPKFLVGTQFAIWAGKQVGVGEVISLAGTSNNSLERSRDE